MRVLAAVLTAGTVALAVAVAVGSVPSHLGRWRRVRRPTPLESTIRRAGLDVTVGKVRWATAASGLVAFGLFVAVTRIPTIAVVPALLAAATPRWWIARHAARRQHAVQQAWPDAIRDLVASIGAGSSLQHGLEALAHSGPTDLRSVFARFAVSARAVGVAPALEAIRDELADATSDRVIEILLVAYERGGSIVPDILRDLATATTRDLWVLEQAQTESLEQRINARAVFVLPWIVLVAVTLQEGPFREFYRSGAGLVVIVIGAMASLGGMWIIRRLGAQTPEPRVME